ncbi:MAG: Lrp/AsnC family transcriptional regulator [Leptothrix sp. (in: b-proteobacteria)]
MDHTAVTLDAVDHRILAVLQKNGRITFDELAREVQLSSSAALRRVRRLEEAGVIAGYAAIVPADKVGRTLTAYLRVQLDKPAGSSRRTAMEQFRSAVQGWPEVVECLILSNDLEHLLRVELEDMAHYQRFVLGTLARHASVLKCKTSFVIERVKTDNGICASMNAPE